MNLEELRIMAILPNAPTYLDTLTYDRSGQVVHPSLIDFWLEFGLPSWGGYRFWMAITPYPFGNNQYKNQTMQNYFPWHLSLKPNYQEQRLKFLICGCLGCPYRAGFQVSGGIGLEGGGLLDYPMGNFKPHNNYYFALILHATS